MLIANTPKERRLRRADVPWFPPIFLLFSPEFTISKRQEPCYGVSLASFLSSPEEENQKATAAGKLARALAASSARISCCFFQPYFPLRRAKSSRRGRRGPQNRGLGGSEKPADAGDPGAQPVNPLREAGKLQAAPTALPPARHSRLLGLCTSSRDLLGGDPTPR